MVVNAKKRTAGGLITVKNDGVVLASGVSVIDINGGAEVEAVVTAAGEVTFFHPAPLFQPYWPTGVYDPVERVSTRISTPAGGEGNPFKTGGWAGANHSTGRTTSFTLASPGNRTGFGGDSTFEINVFDAAGTNIESYTTPALTGNGVYTSPSTNIVVTLTNYGPDSTKWQARPYVGVYIKNILTAAGQDGGRYHVEATHHTDSVSDGGQSFKYTQTDVFLDTNPTTPNISTSSGTLWLEETPGQVFTKHLSGLEYYIYGSQFSITVSGIDQFNRNTARTSQNFIAGGAEFGLPTLYYSPFGTGAGYFSGWTNEHSRDSVAFQKSDWAISSANYRDIGPSANVWAYPRDTWAAGPTKSSPNYPVRIDTDGVYSPDTYEPSNAEACREFIDGVGCGATPLSLGGACTYVG